MKDFDFDELDRAVSSVLDNKAAPSVVQPERTEPTLEIPERQVTEQAPAVSRSSVPARPRTGRFMDVVHPSAATRPAPSPEAVVPPAEVPVPAPEAPARRAVPMNDVAVLPRSEVIPPLPKEAPVEESDELEDAADWSAAPESPFLPDAKVEKRPLGESQPTGVSTRNDEVSKEAPSNDALMQDINALLAEDDHGVSLSSGPEAVAPVPEEVPVVESVQLEEVSEIATPLPELSQEETLESSPMMTDIEAEAVPEFDVVVDSPENPSQEEKAPEVPVDTTSEEAEFTGPVAITPQYTPKPSSNQQSGEIYDTESYHQPITAPAKKKGGPLKLILIILLVLVLGLGVGAGAYFYILPML